VQSITVVGYDVMIKGMQGLTSLAGLNALTAVGGEFGVIGNGNLETTRDLEALTTVGKRGWGMDQL
jgi:hypothetical protein